MKRFTPFLMLVVMATATTCLADTYGTVDMYFVGAGDLLGDSAAVVNVSAASYSGGVYACPYVYQFNNPTNTNTLGLGGGAEQAGFCVDFNDDIYGGATGTFTVEDLSTYLNDTTKAKQIEALMYYATQNQGVASSGVVDFTAGPFVSPASTGLSLAIWTVLLASGDTPPSFTTTSNGFTTTNFAVTSSNTYGGTAPAGTDIAFATALLTDLASGESYQSPGNIYALAQAGKDPLQAQSIVMVGVTPQNVSPVPEPSAWVGLAGLALCCLPVGMVALFRRRRQA